MNIEKIALILIVLSTILIAQTSLITVKQGSIKALIQGPNVLEADRIYAINITLENTGTTVLYNVVVTVTASQGLKVLSWQPSTIGSLPPNENKHMNVIFYTMPDSGEYQTLTFEVTAEYPDGSNVTMSFYKGFIVKSPRTSSILISINTPILCIGRWNNVNLTISVKGNYSISDVKVYGILLSCNGKTFSDNVACVNTSPAYVSYVPAKSKVNVILPVYVSPRVDVSYPIALKFIVSYNELGHLMVMTKQVSTIQSFALTYCAR